MTDTYRAPSMPRLSWLERAQPKPRLRVVEQQPAAMARAYAPCDLVAEDGPIVDINAVLRRQREVRHRFFGEPESPVIVRSSLTKPKDKKPFLYPMKFGPFKPKPAPKLKTTVYPYVFGPRQQGRDWIIIEPKVTMAAIIDAVCSVYFVGKLDLVSQRRTRNLTAPRQVAMYIARVYTELSFPQIARLLGKVDHTTAIHGYSRIKSLVGNDARLVSEIETVKSMAGIRDEH